MDQNAKNEPLVNNRVTPAQRERAVGEWIQGLRQLLSHVESNAQGIIEGTLYDIEECAGLGIPIKSPQGEWGLRYVDVPEGGFALTPLFESDGDLHPYFADQMKGPSYQESCQAIFLPPDKLSPIWRGLILIHEINHAMRHQDRTYRGLKLDHWVEEYETYIEEIELVEEIYGQPYTGALHNLSIKFEDQLRKGKLHLNVHKHASSPLLENLFGKPKSKLEANLQRGVFLFNALYRALDRLHPDGDKEEHHKITGWLTKSASNKNINHISTLSS